MRSRAIHRWNSKTAFTLASFFCLFLFGLFDSLKGSTLSTLLKDLNLNYSLGGTIILGQYSGYFLSTFITGIFIDQLGHRATLILAAASMIIGTAGYASVSTLPFYFCLSSLSVSDWELWNCAEAILSPHIIRKKRGVI